jgi:hypothetical protein
VRGASKSSSVFKFCVFIFMELAITYLRRVG